MVFYEQIWLTLVLSTKYVTTPVYKNLAQVISRQGEALSANEKFDFVVFLLLKNVGINIQCRTLKLIVFIHTFFVWLHSHLLS